MRYYCINDVSEGLETGTTRPSRRGLRGGTHHHDQQQQQQELQLHRHHLLPRGFEEKERKEQKSPSISRYARLKVRFGKGSRRRDYPCDNTADMTESISSGFASHEGISDGSRVKGSGANERRHSFAFPQPQRYDRARSLPPSSRHQLPPRQSQPKQQRYQQLLSPPPRLRRDSRRDANEEQLPPRVPTATATTSEELNRQGRQVGGNGIAPAPPAPMPLPRSSVGATWRADVAPPSLMYDGSLHSYPTQQTQASCPIDVDTMEEYLGGQGLKSGTLSVSEDNCLNSNRNNMIGYGAGQGEGGARPALVRSGSLTFLERLDSYNADAALSECNKHNIKPFVDVANRNTHPSPPHPEELNEKLEPMRGLRWNGERSAGTPYKENPRSRDRPWLDDRRRRRSISHDDNVFRSQLQASFPQEHGRTGGGRVGRGEEEVSVPRTQLLPPRSLSRRDDAATMASYESGPVSLDDCGPIDIDTGKPTVADSHEIAPSIIRGGDEVRTDKGTVASFKSRHVMLVDDCGPVDVDNVELTVSAAEEMLTRTASGGVEESKPGRGVTAATSCCKSSTILGDRGRADPCPVEHPPADDTLKGCRSRTKSSLGDNAPVDLDTGEIISGDDADVTSHMSRPVSVVGPVDIDTGEPTVTNSEEMDSPDTVGWQEPRAPLSPPKARTVSMDSGPVDIDTGEFACPNDITGIASDRREEDRQHDLRDNDCHEVQGILRENHSANHDAGRYDVLGTTRRDLRSQGSKESAVAAADAKAKPLPWFDSGLYDVDTGELSLPDTESVTTSSSTQENTGEKKGSMSTPGSRKQDHGTQRTEDDYFEEEDLEAMFFRGKKFPILDETEISRGLSGYAPGFELQKYMTVQDNDEEEDGEDEADYKKQLVLGLYNRAALGGDFWQKPPRPPSSPASGRNGGGSGNSETHANGRFAAGEEQHRRWSGGAAAAAMGKESGRIIHACPICRERSGACVHGRFSI